LVGPCKVRGSFYVPYTNVLLTIDLMLNNSRAKIEDRVLA